jgi:chain length determinant protein tyrosine kinase EpsG
MSAVDGTAFNLGGTARSTSERLPYHYPFGPRGAPAADAALYAASDPFGARSEAVRTLRSRLLLGALGKQRAPLAIAGARGGAGTSELAANLAIAFAQLGERTLLVDADLRQPQLRQLFALPDGPGLADLLALADPLKGGGGALHKTVCPVPPFDCLSVLCAGAAPPNPQELLSQPGFAALIAAAQASFDVVLIDTPPLLDFADAQLIAARAGACLLVTRRDVTRLPELVKAKALIAQTGANLVGAVLSR